MENPTNVEMPKVGTLKLFEISIIKKTGKDITKDKTIVPAKYSGIPRERANPEKDLEMKSREETIAAILTAKIIISNIIFLNFKGSKTYLKVYLI